MKKVGGHINSNRRKIEEEKLAVIGGRLKRVGGENN